MEQNVSANARLSLTSKHLLLIKALDLVRNGVDKNTIGWSASAGVIKIIYFDAERKGPFDTV